MTEQTEESIGAVTLTGNVSGIRTDIGGGFKITISVTGDQFLKMAQVLPMYQQNVQVALVLLPEGE